MNVQEIHVGKTVGQEAPVCELVAQFPDKRLEETRNKIEKRYRVIEFVPNDDVYRFS